MGVHILEFFQNCKRYKWDWDTVFTKGGGHICKVFTVEGFTVLIVYEIQFNSVDPMKGKRLPVKNQALRTLH